MDLHAKTYILAESDGLALSKEILFPYAWDEWMCRQLTKDSPNYIHIWQHPKAFVLGLRERQLPHVELAIDWLEDQGYAAAVRNSGGAAVPLDSGVVNISLVLPKPYRSLNFRDDFETMIQLLREGLAPWTTAIQVGEIAGGYCPGDYDLSIKGLKFCGISQRRQANGFAVQAFVNVEDRGTERASLVRNFYEIASNGETAVQFPLVDEARMSSLQGLVGVPSASAFIESIKNLHSVIIPKTRTDLEYRNKALFPEDSILDVINLLKKRYAIVSSAD
jgi:octanoyl-[GcvH]:protein N-octanoyltransferase